MASPIIDGWYTFMIDIHDSVEILNVGILEE
jgi:hypothetical protein